MGIGDGIEWKRVNRDESGVSTAGRRGQVRPGLVRWSWWSLLVLLDICCGRLMDGGWIDGWMKSGRGWMGVI